MYDAMKVNWGMVSGKKISTMSRSHRIAMKPSLKSLRIAMLSYSVSSTEVYDFINDSCLATVKCQSVFAEEEHFCYAAELP